MFATADDLTAELDSLQELGVIEWVVDSGDENKWAIGVKGNVYRLNSVDEVCAFLLGIQALTHAIAQKKGIRL